MTYIKVTVQKYSSAHITSPKRFLTIKMKCTIQINPCSGQRIIRTFHVAFIKKYPLGTIQRIHVQAADEMYIIRHNLVAMTISDVCLSDGRHSFLPA